MAGNEKRRKVDEESDVSDEKPTEEETDDPLLKRWFVFDGDIPQSEADESFSIISYNILADCHAQRDYFNNNNNNENSNNNENNSNNNNNNENSNNNNNNENNSNNNNKNSNNNNIEKYWISLGYRHKKIMKQLRHWDSDLICLQEVGEEHYHVLLEELEGSGYKGFYVGRRFKEEGLREGCATFYKTSSFDLMTSQGVFLQDSIWANIEQSKDDIEKIYKELKGDKNGGSFESLMTSLKEAVESHVVTAVAVLRRRKTGSTLVLSNIHVCWDWLTRQDKQALQVLHTIEEMNKISKKTLNNDNNNNDNNNNNNKNNDNNNNNNIRSLHHQVICGDFNSVPTDPLHNIICRENKDKLLCNKDIKMLDSIKCVTDGGECQFSLLQLLPHLFKPPPFLFTSAYQQVQGYNPDSSRFPNDGVVRDVDYIYYCNLYANDQTENDENVSKCVKVLMAPRLPSDTTIPSPTTPSDHILIMAALHDPVPS